MGGHAFDAQNLLMPRMPRHIYATVLEKVTAQLRTIYAEAATPIEGPEKLDHGDVDVLVVPGVGLGDHGEVGIETVASTVNAHFWTQAKNSATMQFAIPWPESESDSNIGEYQDTTTSAPIPLNTTDDNSQRRQKYIQLDVHICPDCPSLTFTLFNHAHGDAWGILGTMLRPFGLGCSPSTFYIRIPELEAWNKNLARVTLSQDPDTVLRYLGLDPVGYRGVFAGREEMMTYLASCRFWDPKRGERKLSVSVDGGRMGGNEDGVGIKAHDRRKLKQRPVFRYWLDVYCPEHCGDQPGKASHFDREEVIQDARTFFGREFAEEFDERRKKGIREMGLEKLWSEVRKTLPCEGADLTFAMKGLKREILGEVEVENEVGFEDVRRAYREGEFEVVKEWAGRHWEEVKERQQRRDREQSTAKLLDHLERLKVENER